MTHDRHHLSGGRHPRGPLADGLAHLTDELNRQVGHARPPLDGRSATFTDCVNEAPQQS
ncbi:hypothetical protein RM550_15800 [Streptomyces sp. DSM 41527]|uniref:Uncharacterized protein n=1 Tax=Streptomyces mooreae TaxID=3075523 RepID=A0ABU2T7J4_9ACTN|nr:hypothetical protein [Streptomyces sp. DSM 41527]MDT0457187.1 hypothetical protein [Streptomyces sp. DSM 41527]